MKVRLICPQSLQTRRPHALIGSVATLMASRLVTVCNVLYCLCGHFGPVVSKVSLVNHHCESLYRASKARRRRIFLAHVRSGAGGKQSSIIYLLIAAAAGSSIHGNGHCVCAASGLPVWSRP